MGGAANSGVFGFTHNIMVGLLRQFSANVRNKLLILARFALGQVQVSGPVFLPILLFFLAEGSKAQAGTATFTLTGLPATAAEYEKLYNLTVAFTYSWGNTNDKPVSGATLFLYELDSAFSDSDIYSQTELSAPTNATATAGSWTNTFVFQNIALVELGGFDDTNDTLQVRARLTVHSVAGNTNIDSASFTKSIQPGVPSSIAAPASSTDGIYTVNWGSAKGGRRYELQQSTNFTSWLPVTNGAVQSWTTPAARPNRSTNYYRVRALSNSNATGDFRTNVGGVVVRYPNQSPTQPGNIAVTNVTATAATVSWGAATDPENDSISYDVQYAPAASPTAWILAGSTNKLSLRITGLLSDTTYNVRVFAQDNNGGQSIRELTQAIKTSPLFFPTISGILDQKTTRNQGTPLIPFTIGDVETPASSLQVTIASSNQTLLPDGNILAGGTGAERRLILTPATDQHGTTIIQVTVTDGDQLTTNTSFKLTVISPPTFSSIPEQRTPVNQTLTVDFTVNDAETSAANLVVTAVSGNQSLVSNGSLLIQGSGNSRHIVITPNSGRFGTVPITLTATDGDNDQQALTFDLVIFEEIPSIQLNFAMQTIPKNGSTGALSVQVKHPTVSADLLALSASSANTNLVPSGNLTLGGTGTNRTVAASLASNQSGSSVITLTVRDPAGVEARTNFVVRTSDVAPPTISNINDQTTLKNTPTSAIAFTVEDGQTGAASLQITKTSSNRDLVADENILLFGSGTNRQVVVRPTTDRLGTAVITLAVQDGDNNTASAFFRVTVQESVAPSALAVALGFGDQTVRLNHSTPPLPLTISPRVNFATGLLVTASSSNKGYVPDTNIVVAGNGTNWTVAVTPVTNKIDVTTITVTATDSGGATASATFKVRTIEPVPPVIGKISDQTLVRNQGLTFIPFVIGDVESPADALIISVVSTNATLLPATNIFFSGSGTNRNLLIVPATNQVGTTAITVTVRDEDQKTASTTFKVTVLSPPFISRIPDQVMAVNQTNVVSFTVRDTETPATNLVVTARSSNGFLLPDFALQLLGISETRQLVIEPTRNQFGTSVITISAEDADKNKEQVTFNISVLNEEPLIQLGFGDRTISRNSSSGPLPFLVSHPAFFAGFLTVSGKSSNTAFVPDANVIVLGNGEARTVTVTPAANQSGTTTITLTVRDPIGLTTSTNFTVRTADAAPPTISSLPNQTTPRNTPTPALTFFVNDTETAAKDLRVIGSSSNKDLVPDENILFTGTDNARQTLVRPKPDRSGTATVTITVTDADNNKTSTSFLLTVQEQPPAIVLKFGDQIVPRKGQTGALPFQIAQRTNFAGSFRLVGRSSNQAYVPDSNILFLGSGTNRTITVAPNTNQVGSTTITVTVIDSDGLTGSASFGVRTAEPSPPTVSNIADQKTTLDTPTAAIPFTIVDNETPVEQLRLSGTSSNQELVPAANILFSGLGTNRTVLITPATGRIGLVTITLTVTDADDKTASSSFILEVADNGAPRISSIANVITQKNQSTAAIGFTVSDSETRADLLIVTGSSENKRLVPDENIFIKGTGTNRAVVVNPAPHQIGKASVTITVTDGAGKTANASFLVTVKPAPPIKGDLDGDTQPDLVFQDADGYLAAWLMDGASLQSANFLVPSNVGDPNWRVVARNDFDRDGRVDLLFQHQDGSLAVWLMNGTVQDAVTFTQPETSGDPNWRVVGAADFNNDDQADLIFQHTDGSLALWYMNGLKLTSARFLEPAQPGDGWRVVGTGDFGGDGNVDLVFQHADGTLAVWFLEDSKLLEAGLLNPRHPGDAKWRVVSVADHNADGQPDLIFQSSGDGTLAVWFMEGISLNKANFLNPANAGGTWKVVPP